MSLKNAFRSRAGRRFRTLQIESLETRVYLSGEPIATIPVPSIDYGLILATPPLLKKDLNPGTGIIESPAKPVVKSAITSGEFSRAVESINKFAFDLYKYFQQQQGNLFLSPMSISTALAMTYAGARGDTAAQMAEVLHLGTDPGIHDSFRSLLETLNSSGDTGKYALDVANALWTQNNFPFKDEYLQLVQTQYGGGARNLNFSDAEGARQIINSWVEEKTQGKIKDLIPSGALNEWTRLVLTNAIYFKGQWAKKFDPALTKDQPFYLESGQSVDVPMMYLQSQFRYCVQDGYQVLEMPYEGQDLSMVILLPQSRSALPDLDYGTLEKLNDWLKGTDGMQNLIVRMPKFKMTVSSGLGGVLSGMGMPLAFSKEQADFSGMASLRPDERLYIDKVLHKAFIEVNEEGTEAAAATVVIICLTSNALGPPPIPEFTADHAFHFFIRDNHTGSILFMGRVTDPLQQDNSVNPTVGTVTPVVDPPTPKLPDLPMSNPVSIDTPRSLATLFQSIDALKMKLQLLLRNHVINSVYSDHARNDLLLKSSAAAVAKISLLPEISLRTVKSQIQPQFPSVETIVNQVNFLKNDSGLRNDPRKVTDKILSDLNMENNVKPRIGNGVGNPVESASVLKKLMMRKYQ